ncbi:cytochrome c [Vibrio crassostreae]|uniref:Cytochrome c-type protein NrfB-like domain-containing protein n=1 Tax=Vibrio crassostreae TaxID=246167 RepID=A0ABP1WMK2_9VIBR|nr:cytochrome c [Vibrio crassostreae]TCL22567.1 cytochrome c-type protein NrfB [Vibrio crassostreae]TCO00506.1 cytochrome c-type protein NrfB [Vibrio crassostreae]TCT47128.1 cytochrome c-type protein NrfB [Vibrio crassostreae]TCT52582.1 cytochrome c-type protein NrfB [Vibrio crassostreae]TCT55735.1 cytochrome c-type protein NrfB [Vibrio crassostreae]
MVKTVTQYCPYFFLLTIFNIFFMSVSTASEPMVQVPVVHNAKSFSSQITNEAEMQTLIKENKRCIRCHQKKRLLKNIDAIASVGAHASTEFYNNCTACHGRKGSHPKDSDLVSVIPFDDHIDLPIFEQNQKCIACHSPESLRVSEWTHDVHATKLTCSNCHNLHRDSDPIIGISKKFRIGLCATCHEAILREKELKSHR